MSVNRNILKSYSNPVLEPNQVPMSLVTTANSRWVLLDWPVKTYITASQGGDCTGLTVQWTTDPSLASEPDNVYPNLTQSVLSCVSQSQLPLTSSLGWSIFIDNGYVLTSSAATTYYLRSFQNVSGGGRGPYSNVVSLQTRFSESAVSNNYYYNTRWSSAFSSSLESPGATGSVLVIGTQTFDPYTGTFKWWENGPMIVPTSSIQIKAPSGSLYPVKTVGPNFDGIVTNGATISIALTASSTPVSGVLQVHTIQDGNEWYYNSGSTNQFDPCAVGSDNKGAQTYQWDTCGNPTGFLKPDGKMLAHTVSVGIVSGSMEIIGDNGYYFKVTATTSSKAGDIAIGRFGTQCGTLTQSLVPNGTNTINKVVSSTVGTGLCGNFTPIAGYQWRPGPMNVNIDGGTVYTSSISASPTSSLGSNITINTSADCVFSVLTFGTTYDSTQYHQQYGN